MSLFISPEEAFLEIVSPENVYFTKENLGITGRDPTRKELEENYHQRSGKVILAVIYNVSEENVPWIVLVERDIRHVA